jgi:hypothetical protein
MRTLQFTETAKEQIRELPRDPHLLKAIWRHFEHVAGDPLNRRFPPIPMLHRADRRRISIRAYQSDGKTAWVITALCAIEADRLIITSLNAGLDHGLESEPEEDEP